MVVLDPQTAMQQADRECLERMCALPSKRSCILRDNLASVGQSPFGVAPPGYSRVSKSGKMRTMSPGREMIFHYPNRYHCVHELRSGDSVIEALREFLEKPGLPERVRQDLDFEQDRLLQHFFIFVDGWRVVTGLDVVRPKQSLLVVASNKTRWKLGDQLQAYRDTPAVGCEICGERHVVYRSSRAYCGPCFLRWYEETANREFSKIALTDRSRISLLLSGERDSTLLTHLLLKSLGARNLNPQLSIFFVNNGNEGESLYRTECYRSAQALCDRHGLLLHHRRVPPGAASSLDNLVQRLSQAGTLKNELCGLCGLTSQVLMVVTSPAERKVGFDLFLEGKTLSDDCREIVENFAATRFQDRIATTEVPHVLPLRSFTDYDNCIYSALAQVDYHVADCPHSDLSPLYRANRQVDQIATATDGLIYEMARSVLSFNAGAMETRSGLFSPIFGLFDSGGSVKNLSYARTELLDRRFPGAMGHFLCPDCGRLVRLNNLSSVLTGEHGCQKTTNGEVRRELGMAFDDLSIRIGDRPNPARRLDSSVAGYRLRPEISVTFGARCLFLFDHRDECRYALECVAPWQSELIRSLSTHGVALEELRAKVDAGVPEGHLAHYLELMCDARLVEKSVSSPPVGSQPVRATGIVDRLGLATLQVGEVIDWSCDRPRDVLGGYEEVVCFSNRAEEHAALARWALTQGKTVYHVSSTGNLLYLGPITAPHKCGCFGCFEMALSKTGARSVRFDLPAAHVVDQATGTVISGLIHKWREWEKAKPVANWVRCYEFFDCIAQRLLVTREVDCALCGQISPQSA